MNALLPRIIKWAYVPLVAAVSFLAGQFFPGYFGDVALERAEQTQIVSELSSRADALELSLQDVQRISVGHSENTLDQLSEFNQRLLALHQAIESSASRFPAANPETHGYISALVDLRTTATQVTGPLDARAFFEAASAYKNARTNYEKRIKEVRPNYLQSAWPNG